MGPSPPPHRARARRTLRVIRPIAHRSAACRSKIDGSGGRAAARLRGAWWAPRVVALRAGARAARRFGVITTVGRRLLLRPAISGDTPAPENQPRRLERRT